VTLALLFLPFIGHLSALMYKLIKNRETSGESKQLLYIKAGGDQAPDVAIGQAYSELSRMARITLENLERALDVFYTGDSEKISDVADKKATINYLNRQITSMLMQMQNVESAADRKKLSTMLYIAADLERIGDHAENIVEYNIRTKKKHKLRLPPAAMEELYALGNIVLAVVALTARSFDPDTRTESDLRKIIELEDRIDDLCKEYTENHIKRLKNEKSDPRGGVAFMGMITDLERCADHANNIANYFLDSPL
jgi:phosphate:Na+ symporter